MNRMELIRRIAAKHSHLNDKDVELMVGVILEEMKNAIVEGRRIEVRGFGSFSIVHHKARRARNPKTGERLMVPEKFVPRFKPGKELRDVRKNSKSGQSRISFAKIRKDPGLRSAA